MAEKTYVEEIDRSMYDFRYEEKDAWRIDAGLSPEIVEQISKEKNDPTGCGSSGLSLLRYIIPLKVPDWGPDISGLNMDDIVTYVRPNTKMSANWEGCRRI